MTWLLAFLTSTAVAVGVSFMLVAAIGIVRLNDVYMRLHSSTKAATLGLGCILLAVALHFGDLAITTKALLVSSFIVITAPVAGTMIAKAGKATGIPLWEGTLRDEQAEDLARPPDD
ncbi:MAG: monovalent cation/H(+) antiporter subunit G [Planctomycetota bacterium]